MSRLSPDQAARNRRHDKVRRLRYHQMRSAGIDPSMVPAAEVRAHVHRLMELGWSARSIVQASGADISHCGVTGLAQGRTEMTQRSTLGILDLSEASPVPPTVEDGAWVPAFGAVRRIQALLMMGWSHDDLSEVTGLITRRVARQARGPQSIRAKNWRAIDRAFRALQTRRGPSPKARDLARGRGYAPPAAWDNIDNPHERPQGVAA